MASHQNVIELNGNRYDASTGRLLKDEHIAAQQPTRAHQPKQVSGGHAIDGVSRRKHAVNQSNKPIHQPAAASHSVHHKTSRSKTLMRKAVQKPTHSHHTTPAQSVKKQSHSSAKPLQHTAVGVDPQRIKRAEHVPKSSLISKFGSGHAGFIKRVASLEVRPAPKDNMAVHSVSTAIDTDIGAESFGPLAPFDLALSNANGHKQSRLKKPSIRQQAARKLRVSPKALNIAAGVFVTLFVGGLIAYRNIPQLAFKIASARAGIKATLPSYQPSGFSMAGPVQYSSGIVSLSYMSNSDDRNFRVVQKSSDWNSQTLLENFVASHEPYQTFQDRGRTIYIYDGSNATWVSGGIWYQIEGESNLNSDQLLRIVSGL